MTKTESAHLTAQTVLIESAEEALQISGAAGVRLAIPDADALIMVGPADWIAKNVPGVEAMTDAEPDALTLLRAARAYIDDVSMESGYGFCRPTNPHDFHPDAECCSAEEIAAHKASCEAYDKGEYTPERGSEWVGSMHILRAPWGIGGYTHRVPEAAALLARIDARLAATTQASTAQAERMEVQCMAECMDMVRQELIEAGVIEKSLPPMMIANAVVSKVAAVAFMAVAEARNAALEEAAAHIAKGNDQVRENGWIDCANERARCAAAIRELRSAGDTGSGE